MEGSITDRLLCSSNRCMTLPIDCLVERVDVLSAPKQRMSSGNKDKEQSRGDRIAILFGKNQFIYKAEAQITAVYSRV